MAITRLALDPHTDEQLGSAIHRAVRARGLSGDDDGRSWEHATIDHIVDHLTVTAAAPDANAMPTVAGRDSGIGIVCDWTALVTDAAVVGAICETVDGNPLPVSTVRRLCCEAELFPVVIGTQGEVLDVGRTMRLATPAQRKALASMYTCCGFPGCTVALRYTQGHQVTDWTAHRGPTNLANLLPLCDEHHHLVHEGGWQLELHTDRAITVTRPDGTVHYEGTSLDRRRPPPPTTAA